MGALNGFHHHAKLENGVNFDRASAIENAVRVLLQGLGEDINREGLINTPLRVARAFTEGTRGYKEDPYEIVEAALFSESNNNGESNSGGLVVVRDIDLFSYCDSCLLPFQVKCHIGYLPLGGKVLGLSKLARVAQTFSKRLQNPQKLADQICASLDRGIEPRGVAVVLQCSHLQNRNPRWIEAMVSAGCGAFERGGDVAWADFFGVLKFRGINVDDSAAKDRRKWCPSAEMEPSSSDPALALAVSTIIHSLGEDPTRKELVETPTRFLNWLLQFKNTKFNLKMSNNGLPSSPENGYSSKERKVCCELSLPFLSQCEHHLLPFQGVVHIGYYGTGSMSAATKSAVESVVHHFGFKLQLQERLTRQIAETVSSVLGDDVMTVVEATHTCMIARGVEKLGSSTVTIAVLGRFSVDPAAREEFLMMIP
ncbi:hypothetical protein M569_06104, partial [Genlisea aurea]